MLSLTAADGMPAFKTGPVCLEMYLVMDIYICQLSMTTRDVLRDPDAYARPPQWS